MQRLLGNIANIKDEAAAHPQRLMKRDAVLIVLGRIACATGPVPRLWRHLGGLMSLITCQHFENYVQANGEMMFLLDRITSELTGQTTSSTAIAARLDSTMGEYSTVDDTTVPDNYGGVDSDDDDDGDVDDSSSVSDSDGGDKTCSGTPSSCAETKVLSCPTYVRRGLCRGGGAETAEGARYLESPALLLVQSNNSFCGRFSGKHLDAPPPGK